MPQSFAHIAVHVVFSTKHRRPVLNNSAIFGKLSQYFAGVLARLDSPAVAIGAVTDHVHFLCNLSRNLAVAELVKESKRATSIWIKEQGPDLRDFHWQNGYGAFSVSASNMAQVQAYILSQEKHHRKLDFTEEFRALLQKHGIVWDEQYVWD